MVLDSKIQRIRDYFGVIDAEDWSGVEPGWIVKLDGIGEATLNYIRLMLCNRGLTLKNDRTPEYWREHLKTADFGQSAGDPELGIDRSPVCPFTILVDSAEQDAFEFCGMKTKDDRTLIVRTERRALGRHPEQLGDYSIDGYFGQVAIERKSVADIQSTVLGWGGARERFETELRNLATATGIVIVEGTFQTVIGTVPARGKKSPEENQKILFRSIIAYQQDYRVPWLFCDSRRMAEVAAFRYLERFWRKSSERQKKAEKAVLSL